MRKILVIRSSSLGDLLAASLVFFGLLLILLGLFVGAIS